MQENKQKLLWVVFLVLVLLIGGVWWYRKRASIPLPSAQELKDIDPRFKELLALVETLNRITLDASILDDPRFLALERIPFSLEDTEIPVEESGRPNPFAPFAPSSAPSRLP